MPKQLYYEQPLNERIRTFLRIEHLFQHTTHRISDSTEWDCRTSIGYLIDILELLSRTDIKSELIKELERNTLTLDSFKANPGVDPRRLSQTIDRIQDLLLSLHNSGCQPGMGLRQNELLQAVRNRSTIIGGTCNFDLPNYHHWLSRPIEQRKQDLNNWLADVSIIHESINMSLLMIRSSAVITNETAKEGFFQQPMDGNNPCQMVRIAIPSDEEAYPEISASKHRLTIRFMRQLNTGSRPTQLLDDIDFVLHRCVV